MGSNRRGNKHETAADKPPHSQMEPVLFGQIEVPTAPTHLWWDGTPPHDYDPPPAAIKHARKASLTELADLYGSDKGTNGNAHGYARIYERLISPTTTKALCEIGVACGASLKMWSTHLPQAKIVGIDFRKECGSLCKGYPNIDIVIDDVLSLQYLDTFDVVIDDASHVAEDVNAFFRHCWDWVKPGGLYIVEDLACTYSSAYTDEYNARFGTAKPNDRGLVLKMVDEIMRNVDHRRDVVSFDYHPELLIIRKRNSRSKESAL
jgi:predicted O-methyltransferase YrrM